VRRGKRQRVRSHKLRANPLLSLNQCRREADAGSRYQTRPSASEPALPGEEQGPPAPEDATGPEHTCPERRRREPHRLAPSGHSRSRQGHSSWEPPAPHRSGPEHSRTEPGHTKCRSRRHNRRSRRYNHSHSRGDGGGSGGDGSHSRHNHRRSRRYIHRNHRRTHRTRTGWRPLGLVRRPRAPLRPPWPAAKSCEASGISSSCKVFETRKLG
jgi:hypothetical protein